MAANTLPSLAEMIAEERGATVPDRDLPGFMSIARRKLLHGEALRPDEFAAAVGCHKSLLGQAAAQLATLGFVIERVPEVVEVNGRRFQTKRLHLTNPNHEPTPADYERVVAEARRRRESIGVGRGHKALTSTALAESPAASASANATGDDGASPSGHGLPVLPGLGQSIVVSGLALNDDGSVTLALRNGVRRWLATVTGVVEVEP